MSAQPRPTIPRVPQSLLGLVDLALDMRWSWSHSSDILWRKLAPDLWAATHNPWYILLTIPRTRLLEAAADRDFVRLLEFHLTAREEALAAPSWFEQTCAGETAQPLHHVAYFSMEFGLSEALPLYSGGLGILSGDFLKTASDLGVPLIGVGLLWQQGYFRQALSTTGEQIELYPFNDPSQIPVRPVRGADGEWVTVTMQFPRRKLILRAWEVRTGRTRLYLLDSNDLLNTPADRGITGELYGDGPEIRLQQEMALGIGGWRLLRQLGMTPEICHLNEGHAALAVLERARCFMEDHGVGFEVALTATRAGNLFTSHTPVDAGFDRFSPELMAEYLGEYATTDLGIGLEQLLTLGRLPSAWGVGNQASEPFNMAFLGIRGSGAVNGVSRLHGEVSRELFQCLFPRWPRVEVPVGHVTNGVHVPSWDSEQADTLWTDVCGKNRWLGDLTGLAEAIRGISDEDLWAFRETSRDRLIEMVRRHVARQGPVAGSLEGLVRDPGSVCAPGVLTLGFARRFATYKRPNLLLHDPDRLERLLSRKNNPVQLLLAGKAHPADEAGKAMIRQWTDFISRPAVSPHVVFLVDYDMDIAEHLVHGVDVWINTPRRPWEACGTSGMKVLVNGGLNLSELDGWWAEAYSPDVGWALGDRLEHDCDPAWDAAEAECLYELLEHELIPEFYDRDERGIPRRWIARVRESMARLAPQFSTNRMMREYLQQYYLSGATAYRERITDSTTGAPTPKVAADLEAWRKMLADHWSEIAFVDYSVDTASGADGDLYTFSVDVILGTIPPSAVRVELYAEPLEGSIPERHLFMIEEAGRESTDEPAGLYRFQVAVPAERPVGDYTPRVVPWHPAARVPLEDNHILWYR